jgi:hypothetical protein
MEEAGGQRSTEGLADDQMNPDFVNEFGGRE